MSMNDFDQLAAVGRQLERDSKDDEAIEYFRNMLEQFPNDPRAYFEYAGSFDSAGKEAEAIPLYRKAIEMGLSGEYLPQVYVQLGSSLRNIQAHDEAVSTLEAGCKQFPENAALRVFLAYALESAGRSRDALTVLHELAIQHIQTPDMERYKRAIRYYTDERAR